ncbi:glycosyltransferase [Brevundimonas sp. TWP2-3-2]|uniref:glycosyltransferase n=1 Tax=unclassified Brevundimonas TaxID=2622653 RepID=UPI003CEA8AD4
MNPWAAFLKWRKQRRTALATPAQRAGRLQTTGDRARSCGDWKAAAKAYKSAIDANKPNGALSLQLGHALKESGDREAAVEAYQAAAIEPGSTVEGYLYLGHSLVDLGRTERAVDAYAACLEVAPGTIDARDAMIRLGARDRLPENQFDRRAAEQAMSLGASAAREAVAAHRALSQASIFPVSAWNRFRATCPVTAPPPGKEHLPTCTVVVDARGLPPWAVRTTLDSLADQTTRDWVACVLSSPGDDLAKHSVAAASAMDDRISFYSTADAVLPNDPGGPVVIVSAGTRLDPTSIAWLCFAGHRTGAGVVHADHDRFRQDWRLGRAFYSPSLFPTPERGPPAAPSKVPAMLWIAAAHRDLIGQALEQTGCELRRKLIERIAAEGRIGHLPRILSSTAEGMDPPPVGDDVRGSVSPAGDSVITAVIPTQNQPRLLAEAVESLFSKAAKTALLRVVLVENRPTPESRQVAARLALIPGVEIVPVDEPFNWPRLNALGVDGRASDILLFMNDDVSLLTEGWDNRLRTHLDRPEVGAVGARLLYPDGTIQHAGIVFGRDENGPAHEGVGAASADGGPLGRWRTTHAASAVTGAFIGCRRHTYDAVGGFDPRFAIGFNDIDFCLKIRSAGLDVVYAADIEAVHHESPSRGLNDTPDRVRWDRDELFDLHQKWGDVLFVEPGVNPCWASSVGRPYDGYREPPLSEILAWLDRSASTHPWSVASAA